MEEWDKSITISQQALAVDCTQTWVQFNLALALLCQKQVDEAKKEYQRGVEMADSESLNAAMTDLREALKKHPDLPETREILAELERHG